MSYDISLCDPLTGETLETESTHMMIGGTFAVGGTRERNAAVADLRKLVPAWNWDEQKEEMKNEDS